MDELDSKLKNIFSENINTPAEYKNTIKNTLYLNKKISKFNFLKIAATFMLCIGITVGFVYASITTYQKIWVEPQKRANALDYGPVPSTIITENDKKKVESEEEAVEIAKDAIKRMGYGEPDIYSVELKKNYSICCELEYVVKTKKGIERGLEVGINAETGECVSFSDRDLKYEDIKPDKITQDEALEIAKDIYSKLGLKDGEYELKTIEEMPHFFQNKGKDMWNVTFCKKYDSAFNYFERAFIGFIVHNGNVKIEIAYYCNEYNFENNPIILSQDDAIEIAKEKDRKITSNEIKDINVELQIRMMNSFIYVQEMSKGKDDGIVTEIQEDGTVSSYYGYKSPEILRKVWVVTIEYIEKEDNEDIQNQYIGRTYFVDTTTGEVIGGEGLQWWRYNGEKNH